MSPYLKSVLSVAATFAIAFGANRLSNGAVDITAFLAGSALWWGVRAYYIADVNTAHKISGDE